MADKRIGLDADKPNQLPQFAQCTVDSVQDRILWAMKQR